MEQSSPEKNTCEGGPKGTSEKKILRPSGGGKRATHIACERRLGRAALPALKGWIKRREAAEPFPKFTEIQKFGQTVMLRRAFWAQRAHRPKLTAMRFRNGAAVTAMTAMRAHYDGLGRMVLGWFGR